jgi:hypothetical protein
MALPYSVPVVYGGSSAPGSLAIRGFTGSEVSHVGLLLPDNTVLEAVGGRGVSIAPLSEFTARYSRVYRGDYPSLYHPDTVISRALTKKGQKYDYIAIVGIVARTGWDHDGKWVCSELIAWASGTVTGDVSRYTQQDAFAITQNLVKIK